MSASPSALRALALHLESVSINSRSHGGHGWTYDEEVLQLRAAAEELERYRKQEQEKQRGIIAAGRGIWQ